MRTFEEAAKIIRTSWIYSMHWKRRAENEGKEWQEIAIADCNNIIYELETKLKSLKDIRDNLLQDINKQT